MVAAILLLHVIEDKVSLLVREVDINVREVVSRYVNESLEHKSIRDWVNGRDLQKVTHQAATRAAACWSADHPLSCELHHVSDDVEIILELFVGDQLQLSVEAFGIDLIRQIAAEFLGPFNAHVAQ